MGGVVTPMSRRLAFVVACAMLTISLVPAAGAGLGSAAPAPVETLDAADPGDGADRLERGLALVDAGTQVQSERAGLGPIEAVDLDHDLSAREAAHAVAQGTGGALLEEDAFAELDTLEPAVDAALADVLVAFLALHQASQASFATVDADPVDAGTFASPMDAWQAHDVDPRPALAARASLLDAIGALDAALASSNAASDVELEQAPALVVDLGEEDDTYTEDVALIVDAGGDDVYRNNAGGTASGFPGLPPTGESVGFPAAALVDLGGDDTHGQIDLLPWDRRSAANGGAFAGVGMLVDDGGEDLYAAYADGVNGGAFLGVGLLLDTAGDDTYSASGWGANGGGYPGGIGQLVDLDGADRYTGSYEAVNGGGMAGTGLLYDGGGADRYEATRLGTNGGAQFGQGLLVDRGEADDAYRATSGPVNGAALGGSGLLYDEGGSDVYEDEMGGSGEDRTVLPKGPAGAQIDG